MADVCSCCGKKIPFLDVDFGLCQVLVGIFLVFLYVFSVVIEMDAACLSRVQLLSHPVMVLFSLYPTNVRLNTFRDAVCIASSSGMCRLTVST